MASHRIAAADKGEGGGDTTGGGGGDARGDFRDWLLGRLITTDASGTGTVDVPLSDDLTSWRVSAAAVDGRLDAGSGETSVAVSLPFFAEATVAPEYLVADRPVIRVRGFGAGLPAGTAVTFTVSSPTLPMSPVTVTAPAFGAAEVPLAGLTVGTHTLRIEATATTTAGATVSDALERTFRVVATRATRLDATWTAVEAGTKVSVGPDGTRIVLADAGRGRVLPLLGDLAWGVGLRADVQLAADVANRVLAGAFALQPEQPMDAGGLAAYMVNDGWLSLVPYGGPDLDVTVLAALAGDPRLDVANTAASLQEIAYASDEERDRRILALAGLAALGQPVLADVTAAAAQRDLTIPERISLALAALAAGDEALARSLEHGVLRDAGLHLAPWTRVDGANPDEVAVRTARLAIVRAALGEPVAAEMDAWLEANPPRTTTVSLERAVAAKGWASRLPASTVKAAVTVDGARREVTIDPGSAAELQPAEGQALDRSVTPSGRVGEADTVVVTLRVTLGPKAGAACWRVVDLVPSGLAPIMPGNRIEASQDGRGQPIGGQGPDDVTGQRVSFCVVRDPRQSVQELRYVARVVNPGSYAWEPAMLQSMAVPDQGLATPAGTVLIAGGG